MSQRILKGIAYFDNYDEAQQCNEANGISGRLVAYDLGWAIQYRVSGPYWPQPVSQAVWVNPYAIGSHAA